MSLSPSSSANEARRALGRRLKTIRTDANLSARELASRAGWGETKVSKLQNAVYFPSDDDLRTWATICGVPGQIPDLIATAHNVEEMYVEWRQRAKAAGLELARDRFATLGQTELLPQERVFMAVASTAGGFGGFHDRLLPQRVPDDTQAPGYRYVQAAAVISRYGDRTGADLPSPWHGWGRSPPRLRPRLLPLPDVPVLPARCR